mgnify:CR=1 FL=1
MTIDKERRIHRLLLQREREFTAVWWAECEINKILGADFPFAEPPVLPSSRKPVKKKKAAKSAKVAKLNSLIRPLRNEENAYRVTYTCQGEKYSGFQNDTAFIRQLIPLTTDSFAIESVEAIILTDIESYNLSEELWTADVPFQV